MARGDRERAQIVDFWRAVELFEPQKVDKPKPRDERSPVFRVDPGLPLPWEAGHPLRGRTSRAPTAWRHTVYCGVFSMGDAHQVLNDAFGADPRQVEKHPPVDTALVAFEVDGHGRALLGSQVVSTCGWAVGRTVSPGPQAKDWLDGFEDVEERFRVLFEWLVAEPGPGPTRALLALLGDAWLPGVPVNALWSMLGRSLKATAKAAAEAAVDASGEISGDVSVGGMDVDFAASGTAEASAGASAETSLGAAAESAAETAADDLPLPGSPNTRVITHRELDACLRAAVSVLGLGDRLTLGFRVRSRPVSDKETRGEEERQEALLSRHSDERAGRTPREPEPDPADSPFLNSFIADDLAAVAGAVRRGGYGAALRAYLSSSGEVRRIGREDLRGEGAQVVRRVAPELTPAGRWPAKDTHPLALSQQVAVNSIAGRLGNSSGLFAVNGPPGTGKTTLLRDLVAHVVVERARRMAAFDQPWRAFGAKTGWKTDDAEVSFHQLDPSLTGFEVVVASANNGAVENVTTEIPGRDAVDERWADADYFAEVATTVLGKSAWGALAAQLGNAANRRRFVQGFWWGDPPGGKKGPGKHKNKGGAAPGGMADLVNRLSKQDRADPDASRRSWREAVRTFREALKERDRLVAVRTVAAHDLERLPPARTRLATAERALSEREQELGRAGADHDEAEVAYKESVENRLAAEAARNRHWEFKPGFWDTLFSLGRRLRAWQHTDDELADAELVAREEERERAHTRTDARHRMEACSSALVCADQEQIRSRNALASVERAVRESKLAWPGHVPVGEAVRDEDRRERSAPWSDPELNRARTEVFLAALEVHRAFVSGAPSKTRAGLRAATRVLDGEAKRAPADAVRAALQSLFLVVPVVSTTFASFHRLFDAFGSESLGWLLVDEAGQATPQQAAGALWRSRRAVVVGDPLQLEPVSTLSFPAQQHLRGRFRAEERWLPARTSVQSLADSATPLGTLLERRDAESIWVGSPLRVHRRCDDPMFSVSNLVAYDGMMVFGTPDRPPLDLPESQWVDVAPGGGSSDDHWRPAEGEALTWLLEGLQRRGHDMADVFVLAPFRSVATGARQAARKFGVERSGTIHTSQGKEASVVVFVLGGAPSRAGARNWAASTPNLLNVAASRAKRRLYVIGDHRA